MAFDKLGVVFAEPPGPWPEKALGGSLKRGFDVFVSAMILVPLLPLLCLVALAIRLSSKGPILFAHRRIGHGGVAFDCYKFRSMVVDAEQKLHDYLQANPEAAHEWEATRKLSNDPRVTAIGRFLRKSSLDELPQIFNVLRGEMSLVGPRPVVQDELHRYGLYRVHYLRARPGITGLWQVSGRSTTSYAERVRLDKRYSLQWSLVHDTGILFRTVPALLQQRGAV